MEKNEYYWIYFYYIIKYNVRLWRGVILEIAKDATENKLICLHLRFLRDTPNAKNAKNRFLCGRGLRVFSQRLQRLFHEKINYKLRNDLSFILVKSLRRFCKKKILILFYTNNQILILTLIECVNNIIIPNQMTMTIITKRNMQSPIFFIWLARDWESSTIYDVTFDSRVTQDCKNISTSFKNV